MSSYFPLFVDLSEKKIVIVGGGNIAARRAAAILPFCGSIVIISPKINDSLEDLISASAPQDDRTGGGKSARDAGTIVWLRERYTRERILDADLVLACTDDPAVNDDICAACRCLGIPVNNCSDQRKCDFFFPGVIRRDNVVIGITASGKNHAEAKAVRKKIEEML